MTTRALQSGTATAVVVRLPAHWEPYAGTDRDVRAEITDALGDDVAPATVEFAADAPPVPELTVDGAGCSYPPQWWLDALAYARGTTPAVRAIDADIAQSAEGVALDVLTEAVALLSRAIVGEARFSNVPPPPSLTIHVQPVYLRMLTTSDSAAALGDVRQFLFEELGVRMPPLHLVSDPTLRPQSYRFGFGSLTTVPRIGPADDERTVLGWRGVSADTLDREELQDVRHVIEEAGREFVAADGTLGTIVPEEARVAIEALGWSTRDPLGQLAHDLIDTVRGWAGWIQTAEATDDHLRRMYELSPALANHSEEIAHRAVHDVLVGLLRDQVPIRNLPRIIQLMLRYHADPMDTADVLTYVRHGLAEEIGALAARTTETAVVYLLAPELESSPEPEGVRAALLEEMQYLPPTAHVPAILTTDAVRPTVADAVRAIRPRVRVLGYGDLPDHLNVQPVARISQ